MDLITKVMAVIEAADIMAADIAAEIMASDMAAEIMAADMAAVAAADMIIAVVHSQNAVTLNPVVLQQHVIAHAIANIPSMNHKTIVYAAANIAQNIAMIAAAVMYHNTIRSAIV